MLCLINSINVIKYFITYTDYFKFLSYIFNYYDKKKNKNNIFEITKNYFGRCRLAILLLNKNMFDVYYYVFNVYKTCLNSQRLKYIRPNITNVTK